MNEDKNQLIRKRKDYRQNRLELKRINIKKERIDLRTTDKEKEIIKRKADELGLDLTNYILAMAIYEEIIIFNFDGIDSFSNQISALGNNINQIARTLNQAKKSNELDNQLIGKVLEELKNFESLRLQLIDSNKEIRKTINKIIKQHKAIKGGKNSTFELEGDD